MDRRRPSVIAPPRNTKAEVRAITVGGIYVAAICHKHGVDFLNCDEGRYLQALRDCPGAVMASWCLRTSNIAVSFGKYINIYGCTMNDTAILPSWSRIYQLELYDDFPLESLSFQHPYCLVMQHGSIGLYHVVTGIKQQVQAAGIPATAAYLSYSSKTIALISASSPRIDLLEVRPSGCAALTHKDHAVEIKTVQWRPGLAVYLPSRVIILLQVIQLTAISYCQLMSIT